MVANFTTLIDGKEVRILTSSVALDAMAPVLELRLDVFELLVVVFCANTEIKKKNLISFN